MGGEEAATGEEVEMEKKGREVSGQNLTDKLSLRQNQDSQKE